MFYNEKLSVVLKEAICKNKMKKSKGKSFQVTQVQLKL